MFYVFEKKNWRWCRYNTVCCHISGITASDGVIPSPKGGGRSQFGPLLNPPLIVYLPLQLSYDRLNIVKLTYLQSEFSREFLNTIFARLPPLASAAGTHRTPPYATDDNGSRSTTEIWEELHGVPYLLPLLLPCLSSPLSPLVILPCSFSLIQVGLLDLGNAVSSPSGFGQSPDTKHIWRL